MVKIYPTSLSGLYIVQRTPIRDHRGSFARIFCAQELSEILDNRQLVQINHSWTKAQGAVRGMHFQFPPYAEMKFVICLRGEVFDVAVDIRKDSPTYLSWHAETLSPDNQKAMVIPEGFAHGFQTLTENCEILYLHTCAYNPEAEGGLNPGDPDLGIDWPLAFSEISQKDSDRAFINNAFKGLRL
jgi:dTDP-4-dehydrorhamnose 3,5-epimerase